MKQPVHPGHANQPYPQQPGAADPYGQQRAAGGGGYGQQPTVLVVPQGAGQAAMRDPEMGMAGQGAGIDSVSKVRGRPGAARGSQFPLTPTFAVVPAATAGDSPRLCAQGVLKSIHYGTGAPQSPVAAGQGRELTFAPLPSLPRPRRHGTGVRHPHRPTGAHLRHRGVFLVLDSSAGLCEPLSGLVRASGHPVSTPLRRALPAPPARHCPSLAARRIIILFILSFGFLIALSCFPSVARKAPRNYFILGAFTVCEGLLLGFISAQYTTFSVVFVRAGPLQRALSVSGLYRSHCVSQAVGMTTVIVSALMLYATFTKTDFTAKVRPSRPLGHCVPPWRLLTSPDPRQGGMIMCLLLTLFLAMIIFFIFPSALTALLYGTVGTIVFSLFIVYDVQLIVGGKHRKYEYGIDDYVFAALSVYLDIVNLFIIMLVCCGEGR